MRNHYNRAANFAETTLFQHTGAWDALATAVYDENALQDVEFLSKFKLGIDGVVLEPEIFFKLMTERPYLRFYTDQKGAMTTFVEEINYQCDSNNQIGAAILSTFCSSINRFKRRVKNNFQEILKEKRYSLLFEHIDEAGKWIETAKISAKDEPALLAAYHFKIFDSETAITILLEHNYLRDAFLCCRLYLPVGHPLYKKVLATWTKKLVEEKNHVAVCKCFMAVNDYKSAAEILLDKNDVACKLNVLNIVTYCGLEIFEREKITSLVENLIVEILADFDFYSLNFVLKCRQAEFKHFPIVCEIHQCLAYILSQNNQSFENCDPCFNIHPSCFTLQEIISFKETNFIENAKDLLIKNGYEDQNQRAEFFDRIDQESVKILQLCAEKADLKYALLGLAIDITKAVAHLLSENVEKTRDILENFPDKFKEAKKVLGAVMENYFPTKKLDAVQEKKIVDEDLDQNVETEENSEIHIIENDSEGKQETEQKCDLENIEKP
uniref:Gem-associated protein 5 TPR domain-containing protein n=1 Tax=Romanomermis culicivorax TaxID=13658 RepID=A0A915ITH8_ROMCU